MRYIRKKRLRIQFMRNLPVCRITPKIKLSFELKIFSKEKQRKTSKRSIQVCSLPPVYCVFFQVHGSKFKPDPVSDLSQASVRSISHCVFFFRVGKYSLNGFFPSLVKLSVLRRMSDIFDRFKIIRPYVFCYCLFRFGIFRA